MLHGCKHVIYEQYHYIALYKCVILMKVRRYTPYKLNQMITPWDFIHKVPTNFHILQCVVEIGMLWLWDLQGLGGVSSWNYNLFKTSYCTLFLYEFFLTQISHRRFLARQYQYKFICYISYFSHRGFYIGVS